MAGSEGSGKRAAGVRRGSPARRVTALVVAVVAVVAVASPVDAARSRGAVVSPSGQAMPIGDVGKWKLVFSDDFTTTVPLGQFPGAVSGKWDAYRAGWRDTSKLGVYDPGKVVSIKNGLMDLYVHSENGVPLVSAPLPRINGAEAGGGQLYGRYAVRFRSDKLPGYKIAWLLWPDSDNWNEGEIDFPEGDLDGRISGFMHYRGAPLQQDGYQTTATPSSWHTAVVEWRPEVVRFLIDNVEIGRSTDRAKIPATPMHWVLQTETNLSGVLPGPDVSGHVQIDWVTVYQLAA